MGLGRFIWEDHKTVFLVVMGPLMAVFGIVFSMWGLAVVGAVIGAGAAFKLRRDWPNAQRGQARNLT